MKLLIFFVRCPMLSGWYHHLNLCCVTNDLFKALLFGIGMGTGMKIVTIIWELL
jgi:hypothetical protein